MRYIAQNIISLALCLILACLQQTVHAQNVYTSSQEKILNKFADYEILGKNELGTVIYYYGESSHQLSILDDKLNSIAKKDIAIQSNSIEDVVLLNDKILVTYVQNTYDIQYCKGIVFGKNLNIIEYVTLDSISAKLDNKNHFYTKSSPDNSKILSFTIIKNKGNTHIRFASYDANFKALTKNLFTIAIIRTNSATHKRTR